MADYRLTPRALADLDAVADYTLNRSGHAQTETYLTALTERMTWLAASPDLGHRRDDIAPGYWTDHVVSSGSAWKIQRPGPLQPAFDIGRLLVQYVPLQRGIPGSISVP